MSSCSTSTKPETGSLSGKVILVNDTGDPALDPIDYSGITVALYNLAYLDTTIVRINNKYPQIGVHINQETEFDHRLQNPIVKVLTSNDGSFTLTNIPVGVYNLSIFKQGWSIIYRYSIDIVNNGNKNGKEIENILYTLYPVYELPSVVGSSFVFKSDHTYLALNDINILSNVDFEQNSKLLINPNKKANFHNNISYSGSDGFFYIDSGENIYSTNMRNISPYQSINIYKEGKVIINGLILKNSIDGLVSYSDSLKLERSVFSHNKITAIYLNNGAGILNDLLIHNNDNKGIFTNSSTIVSNSLFCSNNCGFIGLIGDLNIKNNYFVGNYLATQPVSNNEVIIMNNCFDRNYSAIAATASTFVTANNNFYSNKRDIELHGLIGGGNDPCYPSVYHNNFYGDGYYVHCMGNNMYYGDSQYPAVGINQNYNFPNNYLKYAPNINNIYDGNSEGANFIYTVSFIPLLSNPIIGIGIY